MHDYTAQIRMCTKMHSIEINNGCTCMLQLGRFSTGTLFLFLTQPCQHNIIRYFTDVKIYRAHKRLNIV